MPYFIGFPIEELNPGCGTRDATNQKVNGFAVHDQRQNITTYEMKNGFLLIEVFRKTKLWPPGSTLGGHLLFIRVSSKHLKHASSYHQNNARGHLVKVSSFLLKVISPTNPFLDIRGSNNFAVWRICSLGNLCGRINSKLTSLNLTFTRHCW